MARSGPGTGSSANHFFNPLLLRAYFGIPHNAWFRGNLEGIETTMLARMMPWWRNFSFNVLSHVTMQANFQAGAMANNAKGIAKAKTVKLPKLGFERMLLSLRDWIKGLQPKDTGATVWQHYAENTTYNDAERQAKVRFRFGILRQAQAQGALGHWMQFRRLFGSGAWCRGFTRHRL